MAFISNPTASTAVFDDTAPTSFTDLDLSSIVPAGCVVHLVTEHRSTALMIDVVYRPHGNTTIQLPVGNNAGGVGGVYIDDIVGYRVDSWCATSDGTVEWCASAAQAVRVYVIGWYDATIVDPTCVGTPAISSYSISLTGSSWNVDRTDLVATVGANRVWAIVEMLVDSGSSFAKIAFRASDETEDNVLQWCFGGNINLTNIGQINGVYIYYRSTALVETGPDGKFDIIGYDSAGGSLTISGFVHAYITDIETMGDDFSSVDLSGDVDISSSVGTRDGVALIRVKALDAVSSTDYWVATKPDGDSDTYPKGLSSGDGGINRCVVSRYVEIA